MPIGISIPGKYSDKAKANYTFTNSKGKVPIRATTETKKGKRVIKIKKGKV